MIALVMAGGKGTRMNSSEEKLLLEYKKPVIFHVLDALKNSHCFTKIITATSSNSPKTKEILEQAKIETIETEGKGYSNDLNSVLQNLNDYVFLVSGDLPFLDESIIQSMIEKFDSKNTWTSFLISTKFLNSLNLQSDLVVKIENFDCAYTGISIINANKITDLNEIEQSYIILDDKRIAFNLNTNEDYRLLNSF